LSPGAQLDSAGACGAGVVEGEVLSNEAAEEVGHVLPHIKRVVVVEGGYNKPGRYGEEKDSSEGPR